MAYSFTFNSLEMSTKGLKVRSRQLPFVQQTAVTQLRDRVYGIGTVRPSLPITLDVVVAAASNAVLLGYLDDIREALNSRVDQALTLDAFSDRYWMARFESMSGQNTSLDTWEGEIIFSVHDPAALANSETDNDYTINEDPEAVSETNAGTEFARPVMTLTCDDTLTATDVIITNTATGEALTWEGDLVAADVLEIDCENMIVKLNGVEDMLYVDGEFPRLLPGANALTIEGFSGALNITYRARYV